LPAGFIFVCAAQDFTIASRSFATSFPFALKLWWHRAQDGSVFVVATLDEGAGTGATGAALGGVDGASGAVAAGAEADDEAGGAELADAGGLTGVAADGWPPPHALSGRARRGPTEREASASTARGVRVACAMGNG
jgi:hypothetical protein